MRKLGITKNLDKVLAKAFIVIGEKEANECSAIMNFYEPKISKKLLNVNRK